MTDQTPKRGDTVRVVLEGKVEDSQDGRFGIGKGMNLNWITPGAGHVKSVEILTPPVKVGDTIKGADAYEALPPGALAADGEDVVLRTYAGFADETGDTSIIPASPRTLVYLPDAQ